MRTIFALLAATLAASPAAAQYPPPPGYGPPPGYQGFERRDFDQPYADRPDFDRRGFDDRRYDRDRREGRGRRGRLGEHCEAVLPTRSGPKPFYCPIIRPKPLGDECACPTPGEARGYPPGSYVGGRTVR